MKHFISIFHLELGLIIFMLITLFIPSDTVSITTWTEIPPLRLVRAIIWLSGLSLLLGLYVLRLLGLSDELSTLERIVVGTNLSFVFVSIVSIIFYHFKIDFTFLPYLVLAMIIIINAMNRLNKNGKQEARQLLKPYILLLCAVVIAVFVQLKQRYLIPGDVWSVSKPAIDILSGSNIYDKNFQYPFVFGFLLAGLSISLGTPVINTFALLFPLVSLNIVSFFLLTKVVFGVNNKISVIASVTYTFSGGLAWLIQIFVFQNNASMWTLNDVSQDVYFSMLFWNTMEFSHRTLALTLVFASIIAFTIAIKLENKVKEIITLTLSSLLMLFSFFIHIIEPFIAVPTIFALAYFDSKRDQKCYKTLGLFVLISFVIFCLIDYLMSGYYLWLANVKVRRFVSSVSIYNLIIFLIFSIVGTLIILGFYILRKLTKFYSERSSNKKRIKKLFVMSLVIIYIAGLCVAPLTSRLTVSSLFPWYLYVTRYGFLGILALTGIAAAAWEEKWFKTASFWNIVAIAAGSIWWGAKLNAYLFPMVALFAAVGINAMWKTANNTIHIRITTAKSSAEKHFKLNLKPIMATLVVTILALSFTSFIYGSTYYMTTGPSLTDNTVKALAWINQNTPQNATILVPNIYNIYKSVETISDRKIYLNDKLPNTIDTDAFTNLTKTLQESNIKYAITTGEANEKQSYTTKLFLSYSTIVFQSGQTKVFELPQLKPPSQQYTVATLDKETIGLPETHTFEWIDDNFTTGWNYKNVNATTDGEILAFQWQFNTANQTEPSMKTYINPIDTSTYPYLIIRYRNTEETTTTAKNNIGQIITLVNSTGYPKGFIKNFYLTISKEKSFTIFTAKLPEKQNIAEVWIWMRNYKKLNGTIGLQIDYIGFSLTDHIPEAPANIRFLSMVIPALWPTNYTITPNITATKNANSLITTYDKNVTNHINNQSNTKTFILLNTTAEIPIWGTNWKTIQQGIVNGNLNGKKILIIGISEIQLNNYEDLSKLATSIFQNTILPNS
jgi:hypothetical protein